MGTKMLQVKKWHLTKMDWDQKMGSKKIKEKNWHLKKTNGAEKNGKQNTKKRWELRKTIGAKTTGNKEFEVKNLHRTKMDWDQNMASKTITKESGI